MQLESLDGSQFRKRGVQDAAPAESQMLFGGMSRHGLVPALLAGRPCCLRCKGCGWRRR